jgi:hypothetical protein
MIILSKNALQHPIIRIDTIVICKIVMHNTNDAYQSYEKNNALLYENRNVKIDNDDVKVVFKNRPLN